MTLLKKPLISAAEDLGGPPIDPNITQRPPRYELFFAPLQIGLKPDRYEAVHAAYIASKFGHYGQKRDGGTRYFDHPKAAAWIAVSELEDIEEMIRLERFYDDRLIIDILLHDISEKAHLLSPYRISLNFGRDVALDVRALTKLLNSKEPIPEYVARIIGRGPWAITAKLCDLLHNMRTVGACTPEKRLRKIAEMEEYYIPHLLPALAQHRGVWADYEAKLGSKIRSAVTAYIGQQE